MILNEEVTKMGGKTYKRVICCCCNFVFFEEKGSKYKFELCIKHDCTLLLKKYYLSKS